MCGRGTWLGVLETVHILARSRCRGSKGRGTPEQGAAVPPPSPRVAVLLAVLDRSTATTVYCEAFVLALLERRFVHDGRVPADPRHQEVAASLAEEPESIACGRVRMPIETRGKTPDH